MREEEIRGISEVYLKGLAMGAADAVPGVSGGTIALITGIYERLIDALSSITFTRFFEGVRSLASLDIEGAEKILREIDFFFLSSLGFGILTSVVLVLNLVHKLIQEFPVSTYGFFFGLIAVSAAVLFSEVDIAGMKAKASAAAGFLFAFTASGIGASALPNTPAITFLSGAVAVSAMVLPGISGSLILLILGQYSYISGVLSKFTDAVAAAATSGNLKNLAETGSPIAFFISGALVGLFSVVRLVEKALERSENLTMVFLVSMVVGALRAPILQVETRLVENSMNPAGAIPFFTASALLGGAAILILDRKTEAI